MDIRFRGRGLFSLGLLIGFAACSGKPVVSRNPAQAIAQDHGIREFPELSTDPNSTLLEAVKKKLKKINPGMAVADLEMISERMRHYLLFLGLDASDFRRAAVQVGVAPALEEVDSVTAPGASPSGDEGGEDASDSGPSNLKAIRGLFAGSTQFLFCERLTDIECLEKKPFSNPSALFRRESRSDLGSPVHAGDALDMELFFNQAWDGHSPSSGLVNRLAERLREAATRDLSMAVYGIDDVEGTMKPVYDAILGASRNPRIRVRGIVDIMGIERSTTGWLFSYAPPTNPSALHPWLFGPSASGTGMHATFQYEGTPSLLRELNSEGTDSPRARVEWPSAHIMHNKFLVMENTLGHKAVWTGTANLSNHCMGSELNSNMAAFIRNDFISQAFLDEFNLMFELDPNLAVRSRVVVPSSGSTTLPIGRFHHNKFPVSRRLFTFTDGTAVRVHFAPTDDAQHRVILPMLYSAKAGDEIRISMFGGTGFEIVRAFQYAVAQGAHIRIVFDRRLGHGTTSWIRDPILNIYNPNPFLDLIHPRVPGSIQVRVSTWSGKNHYKAGSLSRKQSNGSVRTEELIFGSQNWSSGGNDENDENVVSIQNLRRPVPSADAFNDEFDHHLWTEAREESH